MKKIPALLCTVAILSSLFSIQMPSANAIFGLSTCEKLKKNIASQDKIGYALWKTYQATWKMHRAYPKNSDVDLQVVEDVLNVLQNDEKLYLMAQKHINCFSAAQSSYMITQLSITRISESRAKTWEANNIVSWTGFWTKDPYPEYGFLLDNIKNAK